MVVAVNLIPFAGIAFLWFVGVLRARIGEREDRFFAPVFLGSGLLFVAMLFVAAAFGAGLVADMSSGPPNAPTLVLGRNVSSVLLNVYAMRMAAVFTLTTVTIARRTEIVSRWLTGAGLMTALVLLVGVGISAWAELLFPVWILALSVDVLVASLKGSPASTRVASQAKLSVGPAAGHRNASRWNHQGFRSTNSAAFSLARASPAALRSHTPLTAAVVQPLPLRVSHDARLRADGGWLITPGG